MLTFEQFQATRRECADLGAVLADEAEFSDGFLYIGKLYIEKTTFPAGKYHLTVERDDFLSDDLGQLERRLYDFGCDAGYMDATSEDAINFLIDEYTAYCFDHQLATLSADELLCSLQIIDDPDGLHKADIAWLTDFIRRWEIVS